MTWPKTGAIQYHAQLGLTYKGRVVKELVVCWVLQIEKVKLAPLGIWLLGLLEAKN